MLNLPYLFCFKYRGNLYIAGDSLYFRSEPLTDSRQGLQWGEVRCSSCCLAVLVASLDTPSSACCFSRSWLVLWNCFPRLNHGSDSFSPLVFTVGCFIVFSFLRFFDPCKEFQKALNSAVRIAVPRLILRFKKKKKKQKTHNGRGRPKQTRLLPSDISGSALAPWYLGLLKF